MRPDYVHIAVVLDRSGSMDSIRSDTIGGFNHFLSEQKKVPGYVTVTLVEFDHEYLVRYSSTPLIHVRPLTEDTYRPRGSTALLNAIGRTIRDTGQYLSAMPEHERPSKVLFVIVTDGHENASHEESNPAFRFTKAQINEMISLQRNQYSWEFVFLGANQDAIETGSSLGISRASSMTYAANSVGTQSAYASLSGSTSRLRCAAGGMSNATFQFSEEDRKAQEDAAE